MERKGRDRPSPLRNDTDDRQADGQPVMYIK